LYEIFIGLEEMGPPTTRGSEGALSMARATKEAAGAAKEGSSWGTRGVEHQWLAAHPQSRRPFKLNEISLFLRGVGIRNRPQVRSRGVGRARSKVVIGDDVDPANSAHAAVVFNGEVERD
jgi:hypothetical protein